jgi:hypothetical protein
MANLQEDYQWKDSIHEWAEEELITGGPDGTDNVPPRQLAGRTQALAVNDLISADAAAMGVKESMKTVRQRLQEGVVAIYNRGVVSGCAGSKAAGGRKVVIAAGGIFALGKQMPYAGDQSGIAVPVNGGGTELVYYGYLSIASDGSLAFNMTGAGALVPADGMSICRISVPAGNSAADLAGVTVTDTRRVEANYPVLINSASYASVALPYGVLDAEYAVYLDVAGFSGPPQRETVYAGDKAANGFKVFIEGSIDAVTVRWLAVKLSL